METENLELEEGEVLDETLEEEDVFAPYNILKRPIQNNPEPAAPTSYSEEDAESSARDTESDSDSGPSKKCSKLAKKSKVRLAKQKRDEKSKDKYKVWCSQAQEETLAAGLNSCGVTHKQNHDRNVEAYNYKFFDDEEQDFEQQLISRKRKRPERERSNVKSRLGVRPKKTMEKFPELSATVESTEDELVKDLAEKLGESKDSLIKRVVEVVGKAKAIDFYRKTKETEESGGMMTVNGARRRTPGGVYLYYVKHDRHIPQVQIRDIFYQDKKMHMEERRRIATAAANARTQILKKKLQEQSNGSDLPALLTRGEIMSRAIAEETNSRSNEAMERLVPSDSDGSHVSNPPPSPVTDDPDHSDTKQPPHFSQHPQPSYADIDVLDITIDADSMDLF